MKIISRGEAKEQGLKRYFTGKPCKHGHLSERYVNSGACVQCSISMSKLHYDKKRKTFPKDAITRKQAIELGLRRYYTGHPCNKGHLSERRVSDRSCLECRKERYNKNYEILKKYRSGYYRENKNVIIESNRRYYEKNREKLNAAVRARYNTDPNMKLAHFIRGSLRRVLVGGKSSSTFDIVGYTPDELRTHLESLFEPGMCWDNYGIWHIDHIIPVSYLIQQGETDPAVINALDNLRPLWAEENLSKGAKYNPEED